MAFIIVISVVLIIVCFVVLWGLLKDEFSPETGYAGESMELQAVFDDGTPKNWLLGVKGPVKGQNFHIGQRVVTLGRASTNSIKIEHPESSRVHCSLIPLRGTLQIMDLDSRNGTRVNGKRVERTFLNDGDRVRVCDIEFIYRSSGAFPDAMEIGMKPEEAGVLHPTIQGLQGPSGEWVDFKP